MKAADWKTYGLLGTAVCLVALLVLAWFELSRPFHPLLAVVDHSPGAPTTGLPSQAEIQTLQRQVDAEMLIAAGGVIGLIVIAFLLVRIAAKRLNRSVEPDLSDIF